MTHPFVVPSWKRKLSRFCATSIFRLWKYNSPYIDKHYFESLKRQKMKHFGATVDTSSNKSGRTSLNFPNSYVLFFAASPRYRYTKRGAATNTCSFGKSWHIAVNDACTIGVNLRCLLEKKVFQFQGSFSKKWKSRGLVTPM